MNGYLAALKSMSGETVKEFLKEMVNEILSNIEQEEQVHLSGLGTFHVEWMEARQGHDPQNGQPIEIPAHNHLMFRPDAAVRRFINRDYAHLKPVLLDDVGTAVAEEKHKNGVYKWLLALISVLLIIAVTYILIPKEEPAPVKCPVAVILPFSKSGSEGGTYIVKEGDDLWDIAETYYRDKYLWPNIYRANLDRIDDPDVLEVGKEITIPSFEGHVKHWTKKDLNEIAVGHMDAYLAYK
jgi:nucleoid DNA-binding protein